VLSGTDYKRRTNRGSVKEKGGTRGSLEGNHKVYFQLTGLRQGRWKKYSSDEEDGRKGERGGYQIVLKGR